MGKTNVEYADEQITIYPTCVYRCKYCWASLPIWRYRIRNPNPIREAMRIARSRKRKAVVISFTSDPYQPRERNEMLTRRVLEILLLRSKVRHTIMILTKNPRLALERDYILIKKFGVWLGTTLTSTEKIPDEPYAPSNRERIEMLKAAHSAKILTWVSIEPWIPGVTDPAEIVKTTHEFVDWYVIGRLDYETQLGYPKAPEGWYAQKLPEIIDLLRKLNKPYHIKKQLKKNP